MGSYFETLFTIALIALVAWWLGTMIYTAASILAAGMGV